MSLTAGARLGPYEIRSLLGSGGMGEVYRAEDTRLGREVAIKILPPAFTSDPDRLARFEREARVLASLNHPNIAAIHGIEEAAGVRALVLELVEGQTLADRIAAGLSVAESIAIAGQIVDALDGAHERGIVHRDLKPANVKITPDGVVKVLDFGIAKVAPSNPNTAATMASTQDGLILGTAAYMSPEQARGLTMDKRTDIWAFGCVLFEMLSGRAPFNGSTTSDIIAAILEREPDWRLLPDRTPPSVRTLLGRCLEKDGKRRLRDIGDARGDLDGTTSTSYVSDAVGQPRTRRFSSAAPWLIAAAAVVAAIVLSLRTSGLPASPESLAPRRFSIVAPTGARFTPLDSAIQAQFSLSPDGSRLAFIAARRGERSRLWVQNLESSAVLEVSGTEDALGPFWSHDGQRLGFFARGKLKKVTLDGGAPQELADVEPDVNGGTWNRDGVIVFGGPTGAGLYQVSENGGPATTAATLDASRNETGHRWPQFLPDGRRFLFYVRSSVPANSGVYVGSLDEASKRQVLPSLATAVYSGTGHLLFGQAGSLAVRAFNAAEGTLTGEVATLGDRVRGLIGSAFLPLSVARDGTLAYWDGQPPLTELLWVDRSGKQLGKVGTATLLANPSLSPDATRLLITQQSPDPNVMDVWRMDVATGVKSRLTFSGFGRFGIWSPDALSMIFGTPGRLLAKPISGGQETPVEGTGNHFGIFPEDWSMDGEWVLYNATGNTGFDIWGLNLADRKSRPIIEAPASQVQANLSPDGRWLAYASDQSGGWEVYVQPFPDGLSKWQISAGGGSQPRWRGDGRELYYISGEGQLVAVAVSAQPTFEAGARRPLLQTRLGPMLAPFRINYDVSPDGQRVLINSPLADPDPTRITIVLNWQAELGARARRSAP